MRFVDEVSITVKSGDGGKGGLSFRKTKRILRGGPDGGDGGKGADVILRADPQLSTLEHYLCRKVYRAAPGEPGKSRNQHGRNAPPSILPVPLGTVIRDALSGEILAEIIQPDQEVTVAEGGRGGKGNTFFATATHRTPRFSQEGEKGIEKKLRLELKLIADVGIIGSPSSGKSTLLARITGARPMIADYPFTTKHPCPGARSGEYGEKLLLVELPGIVKGSHEGSGLGLKFLRHAERSRLLLYLLDLSRTDLSPLEVYRLLEEELAAYDPSLLRDKVKAVVLNKEDTQDHRWDLPGIVEYFKERNIVTFTISSLTGEGIEELISFLWVVKGSHAA